MALSGLVFLLVLVAGLAAAPGSRAFYPGTDNGDGNPLWLTDTGGVPHLWGCVPPRNDQAQSGFCMVSTGTDLLAVWSESANGHTAGSIWWSWQTPGTPATITGVSQVDPFTPADVQLDRVFVTANDGNLYDLVFGPSDGGFQVSPTSVNLRRGACANDFSVGAPALQQVASSNAAFRQKVGADLVFVGTVDGCGDNNGRLYAFYAANLAVRWSFNLEYDNAVTGGFPDGCTVDTGNNQLYCVSGSSPQLYAFDTTTSGGNQPLWTGQVAGGQPGATVSMPPQIGYGGQHVYVDATVGQNYPPTGVVDAFAVHGHGRGSALAWETSYANGSGLFSVGARPGGLSWVFLSTLDDFGLAAIIDNGTTGTLNQTVGPDGPFQALGPPQTAPVYLPSLGKVYIGLVHGSVVECSVFDSGPSAGTVTCGGLGDSGQGPIFQSNGPPGAGDAYELVLDSSSPNRPPDRLEEAFTNGYAGRLAIPYGTVSCAPGYTADLSVSMSGPSTGLTGRTLTYQAVVANNGPDTASDVRVASAIPEGSPTITPSQGQVDGSTIDLGALMPGSSAAVTFATTTTTAGAFTNTVSAYAGECDLTPADDSASVTTTVATLDHLVLSPATSTISAGGSQAYTAEGYDAQGNDLGDFTSATSFKIAPSGSAFCFANSNSCTATKVGQYTVTGTLGTAQGTASQTVTPGPMTSLMLSPVSASITYGGTQTYTAEALDAYSNDVGPAQPNYSISPDGSCLTAVCTPASAGPHTITGSWGTATGTASLDVSQAPLSVTADDQSIVYGSPIPAFTYQISGFVLGQTLASSGVSGSASCSTTATTSSPAGSYPITCTQGSLTAANYTFPPGNFTPGTLTITQHPAVLSSNGQQLFSTGSPNATTATVTLQGQLAPTSGGSPDPSLAKPVFALYVSSNLTMTSPDQTCQATVSTDGAVSCTIASLPADTWTVILELPATDGYFTAANADPIIVTVYQPITASLAAAGGWIVDPSYQNLPVLISAQNNHGSLGYSASYKPGTTTPQGSAAYSFRGADGNDYLIKSSSWQGGGLTITNSSATLIGKATVIVLNPATGQPVTGLGGSNYSYRIDASTQHKLGTFAINVHDPAAALYHQAGTPTSQIILSAGNTIIHH
jgi:uncharacterized repeat protein (TIGR01451 family)